MHNPLIAGAYFSLACCLCVGGLLSLLAHFSGRRNTDYQLFGLLSFVVAGHSVGTGIAYLYGDGSNLAHWNAGTTVALAASILAGALHLHLSFRYARLGHRVGWALGVYTAAGVLALLAFQSNGAMLDRASPSHFVTLGLDVSQMRLPVTKTVYLTRTALPMAHLVAGVLFGRAYLRGRSEGLVMFVAAGLLTLTATNDTLIAFGTIRGLALLPLGLALFSTAMGISFLRRYNLVRDVYGQQVKTLNDRTKQLRRSRRLLRELQSELGRKEQLAAIGEMAAVIAHEVRNPLAVISNAVASLRHEGLSRHDRDVLLAILDDEAIRLNRLVSDLLSYARPIALQRQRVVLRDLSQHAALVNAHPEATVTFDESSVHGQVWGDANLLRQVFDNLVENAVQATGGGGTVTIAVKQSDRGGAVGFMVTVTDDGEGMDTQVRNRAKDPFFTTRPSGTGLGLAIVSRIVEAHGGEVWFESHAGEGTTVGVFLPVGAESSPPLEGRRQADTVPPLSRSDERPIHNDLED